MGIGHWVTLMTPELDFVIEGQTLGLNLPHISIICKKSILLQSSQLGTLRDSRLFQISSWD